MDPELSDTLIELLGGLYQADDEVPLTVVSVEIKAPVTVRLHQTDEGLLLLASPPVTAFRTGIEPVVHPLTVTATSASTDEWPIAESETRHVRPG